MADLQEPFFGDGRGPKRSECPAYKTVTAPFVAAPDHPSVGAAHEWRSHCARELIAGKPHAEPHADVAGHEWETVA